MQHEVSCKRLAERIRKMDKQDLLTSRGFKRTIMYGSSGEIEAVYAPFRQSPEKIKLVWVFKATSASTSWTITIGHHSLGKATTLDELDQILATNNLSRIT